MEHDVAIKNNAAERYLLGELNEREMEEYEEHFFSCSFCAEEVKIGSEFIDHAREVFKTDFLPEPDPAPVAKSTIWGRFWSSLRVPAPAFACALFVLVGSFSIYQYSVITDLRKPELFTSEAKMLRASRGANDKEVRMPSHQPIRIAFQIPNGDFGSYIVEILNDKGVKQSSMPVTASQAKNTIQVKFRSGSLQPGNYIVVIEGVTSNNGESGAQQEVIRYPFSVSAQE